MRRNATWRWELERGSARLNEVRERSLVSISIPSDCLDCERKSARTGSAAVPWTTLLPDCREAAERNRSVKGNTIEEEVEGCAEY